MRRAWAAVGFALVGLVGTWILGPGLHAFFSGPATREMAEAALRAGGALAALLLAGRPSQIILDADMRRRRLRWTASGVAVLALLATISDLYVLHDEYGCLFNPELPWDCGVGV